MSKQGRSFTVHFLGATNTKGARMSAVDTFGQRKSVAFDYELSDYQNAREAAIACSYASGLGRPLEMVGASTAKGWVFIATTWASSVQGSTNREGLTWVEWMAAAGLPTHSSKVTDAQIAAWEAGEDPSEHRAGVAS